MSKNDDLPLLPQDTRTDQALELTTVVAGMVPWLGGAFGAVLSGVLIRRKWDRVTDVVTSIAVELREFESDVSEQYVKTDEFQDLLDSALRKAADERDPAKRRVYRDFIVNIIRDPGDPDVQIEVLRVVEQLTEDDLRVLRALDQEPSSQPRAHLAAAPLYVLENRVGGMTPEQLELIVSRLQNMRLVGALKLSDLMGGDGAEKLKHTVTTLGRRVLDLKKQ